MIVLAGADTHSITNTRNMSMPIRNVVATLFAVLALAGQALAAGSISLSGSQQFDAQGRPLAGGLLYFFQAGTTTPQNAFIDTALTLPYPNPIVLAADGRVPFFYLADGGIKIRLTDSTGVVIVAADNILVIGPSSGGGGGGSVDPTTVYQTGDVKIRYGTGTHNGWVRAAGRTIGSATSGGTERANADCQALFEYLWTADPNLTVSSGRGASANADWVANKTITLPDYRGRVVAGNDDMGNSAAGRITAALSGITGTTLGAAGGLQVSQLIEANLPPHAHSLSVSGTTSSDGSHAHSITDTGHTHTQLGTNNTASAGAGIGIIQSFASGGGNGTTGSSTTGITINSAGAHTHTVTSTGVSGNGNGTNAAFAIMPPTILQHVYLKL